MDNENNRTREEVLINFSTARQVFGEMFEHRSFQEDQVSQSFNKLNENDYWNIVDENTIRGRYEKDMVLHIRRGKSGGFLLETGVSLHPKYYLTTNAEVNYTLPATQIADFTGRSGSYRYLSFSGSSHLFTIFSRQDSPKIFEQIFKSVFENEGHQVWTSEYGSQILDYFGPKTDKLGNL